MMNDEPQPSEEELPPAPKDIDLPQVHGSILREKADPGEGFEPVPLWLMTLFFVLTFWGGGYLMLYSGGFRWDVYDHTQITWGPVQAGEAGKKDPLRVGEKFYTANCATCHQADGNGQPGVYPPLAGSEYVQTEGDFRESHLVLLVLHGMSGPVTVQGSTYNGAMPNWNEQLNDEQIASILTYIRQAWGNTAGPISPEGVALMRSEVERAQPWTMEELMKQPVVELPFPSEGGETPAAGEAAPAEGEPASSAEASS